MHDAAENHEILDILLAERRRLVDVAQRVLKCRARAEDVVQEVALKLCETRPGQSLRSHQNLSHQNSSHQNFSNPRAYLTRMVRNSAVDSARRMTFECRLLAPIAAADDTASPCSCPLERIETRETLGVVAVALAAAPARARRALLAHRLDAVPQKAIAAQLGVSPTLVNFMIRDTTVSCRRAVADEAMPHATGDVCEMRHRPLERAGAHSSRIPGEAAAGHAR